MMRRCVVSNRARAPTRARDRDRDRDRLNVSKFEHEHDYEETVERRLFRNESPSPCSLDSSFAVQSQSQQAHGSVPFSCRQFRREWASFTVISSKYFSQYGRSSSSGGSQKPVSTQVATPV